MSKSSPGAEAAFDAGELTCTCEFPIRGDDFGRGGKGEADHAAEHVPMHMGPDFGRCLACGLRLRD